MESRSSRRSAHAKDSKRLLTPLSRDPRGPRQISGAATRRVVRTIRRIDQVFPEDLADCGYPGVPRIFTSADSRTSSLRALEVDVQRYDALLARAAAGEPRRAFTVVKPTETLSPKVFNFVISVLANVLHDDAKLAETAAFLTREYVRT